MSSSDENDLFGASFERSTSLPLDGDDVPLRKLGYIPSNCGEPKAVISNKSTREVYRRMTFYIAEDPERNCCTINADDVLKLYKVIELPVKLTKVDRETTFFCSENLHLEH